MRSAFWTQRKDLWKLVNDEKYLQLNALSVLCDSPLIILSIIDLRRRSNCCNFFPQNCWYLLNYVFDWCNQKFWLALMPYTVFSLVNRPTFRLIQYTLLLRIKNEWEKLLFTHIAVEILVFNFGLCRFSLCRMQITQ
jgi:hypothetical protein